MANGEKIKNEDLRKTLKKGNGKRILLLQNGVKGLKIAFFRVINSINLFPASFFAGEKNNLKEGGG